MATQTATAASPFTKAVVSSMRKLYPEALADKSFDNTGLLLEAPFDPLRRQMNSVLLTVDLTRAVADEAIENDHSVVVAYHPIIFRGLKSLTLADSQQSSLLRLALEGISVYCPHTAVDAVPAGMTDWLCDIVSGKLGNPEPETHTAKGDEDPVLEPHEKKSHPKSEEAQADDASLKEPARPSVQSQRSYSKPTYPGLSSSGQHLQTDVIAHKRSVIYPSPSSAIDTANANANSSTDSNPTYTSASTGAGRLITFDSPQPLTHLIERIARGVGNPKGFPVAIPQSASVEDIQIRTVGVCPGSGGSILRDCVAAGEGGLLFTGELSHHEALAVTEKGGCVVSLFHSNSERGYLHNVMKGKLESEVKSEWKKARMSMLEEKGEKVSEDLEDALKDENVAVEVSERDRDPYGIVILQASEQEGTKI